MGYLAPHAYGNAPMNGGWISTVGGALWWVIGNALGLAALAISALAVYHFYRVRKSVLFEAWVNRSESDTHPNLGRSLADLLLYKIRAIQDTHDKSVRRADLWNKFYDIPAFHEGLDDDLVLLASVELGQYGAAVGRLVAVLFRLLPTLFQPARLKGSIHSFGGQVRFHVSLENYSPGGRGPKVTRVWEAVSDSSDARRYPDLVEELAYQIYLELSGNESFKSWLAFRESVLGLQNYLQYTDLPADRSTEQRAEEHYTRALAIDTGNSVCAYNLGVLRYFRYQGAENLQAIRHFREALHTTDQKLRALALSGLTNALTMQFHRFDPSDRASVEEAVEHGRAAVALLPASEIAHKAVGFALHQYGFAMAEGPERQARRREAIAHYQEAFRLNPRYHLAHNNLGNLYLEWAEADETDEARVARLKQALAECERAVNIYPAYFFAYDNMGNVHYALGDLSRAASAYRQALQYKPDYAEAANDLAMVRLDQGSPEDAVRGHLQAAGMVSGPQQRKLCTAFTARVATVSRRVNAPLDVRYPPDAACQCPAAGTRT